MTGEAETTDGAAPHLATSLLLGSVCAGRRGTVARMSDRYEETPLGLTLRDLACCLPSTSNSFPPGANVSRTRFENRHWPLLNERLGLQGHWTVEEWQKSRVPSPAPEFLAGRGRPRVN